MITTHDGHDRGISPVVGVVLMAGLAVLLAAVIGAMAVGLTNDSPRNATDALGVDGSDEPENVGVEPPAANVSVTVYFNTAYVTHDEGDSFEASNVRIEGNIVDSPVVWGQNETVEPGDHRTVQIVGDRTADVVVIWNDGNSDDVILGES